MFALDDYLSVIAIADEAHFGRAARRLGITQPSLSARLRRVEEALGARLFDRDRGGVRVTPAGLQFVAGAERVVAAARDAERAARQAAAGLGQTLRLGMTQVAAYQIVVPTLAAFRAAHPGTQITLTERTTLGLERMLEAQTLDAAFLHPPLHAPGLSEHPLVSAAMARFEGQATGQARPLIRFPRAEAPVLMGALARTLENEDDAGDGLPGAETDTMLGAIVLSRAGYGPFTAPEDYPSPFGSGISACSTARTGIVLETAIAWRTLDRRPLLKDLVEAAKSAARASASR